MNADPIDRVFGRERLRMVTSAQVEVFREAAAPGEARRYTKRFLATAEGDYGEWTEREWRILARLIGHGTRCVPDVVQVDRDVHGPMIVRTYDAGATVDQWATLLPVERDGCAQAHVFQDCAHWWALAHHCLAALQEIHAIGLVHLDVKADNVCIPVGPDGFDPASPNKRLFPRFDRLALIDFAFSLASGEILTTPLPIGWQCDYDYQSPRLLQALEAGRAGDLRPTEMLDWRCDFYSLAAMLKRYLPDDARLHDPDASSGWSLPRCQEAKALILSLREAHDGPATAERPHARLLALTAAHFEDETLAHSLRVGWRLARDTVPVDAPAVPLTPLTRIAPTLRPSARAHEEESLPAVFVTARAIPPQPRPVRGSRWSIGLLVGGAALFAFAGTRLVTGEAALDAARAQVFVERLRSLVGGAAPAVDVPAVPAPAETLTGETTTPERGESGTVADALPALDVGSPVPAEAEAPRTEKSAPVDVVPSGAERKSGLPTPPTAGVGTRQAPAGRASASRNATRSASTGTAEPHAPRRARTPAASAPARSAKGVVAPPARSAKGAVAPAARSATGVVGPAARSAPPRPTPPAKATTPPAPRSEPMLAMLRNDAVRAPAPSHPPAAVTSPKVIATPPQHTPHVPVQAEPPMPVITPAPAPVIQSTPALPISPPPITAAHSPTVSGGPGRAPIVDISPLRDAAPAPMPFVPAPVRVPETVTSPPASGAMPEPAAPRSSPRIVSDDDAYLEQAQRALVTIVPKKAAQVRIQVAPVLRSAADAHHPSYDRNVFTLASTPSTSNVALTGYEVAPREARRLHDNARRAYWARRDLREVLELELKAFGADPNDAEIAGQLAVLHLRTRPMRPDLARLLALHALGLRTPQFPAGRPDDWITFAVASALTERPIDAAHALYASVAIGRDADRVCHAALSALAAHGEPLREPVEALLARLHAQGRTDGSRGCTRPQQRLVEWRSR